MASGSRTVAEQTARFFSLLSDPSRLLILEAVSGRGGANVQTICQIAGMSQSAVSHQLRTLVEHSVVRASKKGREVTYTIALTRNGRHVSRLLRFK